jgi:hypothetical protein
MDPAIQAVLTQLQTEVLTLQASAAANAAAAVPLPAGPPTPPVFTLAPALANTATYLVLTSSTGAKHFKGTTTEPLSAQPFDFTDPSDLQVFLDLALKKSQVWGWNTIFTIPVTNPVTATTTSRNLLSEYGMISLESVTAHVLTYYATPSKQAQDSFMNPTTKDFEGKQYHVSCQYHPNQWVCHSPQECSKNPANSDAAPLGCGASSTPNSLRLKAAKLAVAVLCASR